MAVEREVRGIPLWLIREYLEELGGTPRGEDAADGDGWSGRLEQIEDFTIGSLAIGQVRITLEGDADHILAARFLKCFGHFMRKRITHFLSCHFITFPFLLQDLDIVRGCLSVIAVPGIL